MLGPEIFDKLRQRFGGQELKVSRNASDDHPLVVLLGKENAKSFCDEFGGQKLYIPQGEKDTSARDKFIRNAIANGVRRSDIAKQLGISDRWLRSITTRLGLSNHPKPPKRRFVQSLASRTDALIVKKDDAGIKRWERAFQRHEDRLITKEQARGTVGLSEVEFARLLKRFRKTGTIVPAEKLRVPSLPVSNAGLTGLAPVSGSMLHTTPENRTSGL